MVFETLNTITTDLLSIVRGAEISASEPISKVQLENWLHQYRAILIAQDINKKRYANPDYIQEISNLSVESTTEEGGMYRTVLELPKTIDLNYRSGFTWVGNTDGIEYQYMPQKRNYWQQHKKYTGDEAIVFLKDNKLYTNIDADISVRGIFENPMEVGRFINPNTNLPYMTPNSKYPVPNNIVPVIKEMILKKELGIEAQAPSDDTNNSKHDI
jgi:hypothetical protein